MHSDAKASEDGVGTTRKIGVSGIDLAVYNLTLGWGLSVLTSDAAPALSQRPTCAERF